MPNEPREESKSASRMVLGELTEQANSTELITEFIVAMTLQVINKEDLEVSTASVTGVGATEASDDMRDFFMSLFNRLIMLFKKGDQTLTQLAHIGNEFSDMIHLHKMDSERDTWSVTVSSFANQDGSSKILLILLCTDPETAKRFDILVLAFTPFLRCLLAGDAEGMTKLRLMLDASDESVH